MDYNNPWIFEGKAFTDDSVGDLFGFVYIITNKSTGKKYVGKKLFTIAGYKTIKGKRKKIRKPSDWKEYYGSSPRLQTDLDEFGKDNFSREIVRLCQNRGECTYFETKYIFETDSIIREDYYNEWCKATIQASHIKHLFISVSANPG